MPKKLENVRKALLEQARLQVTQKGYAAVTMRSIASACGVGVGTIYNYFSSKDMLIASYMLEDWQETLRRMQDACVDTSDATGALFGVCTALADFVQANEALFHDVQAAAVFAGAGTQRHEMLRAQIAAPLARLCTARGCSDAAFLSEFLAEALLSWTVQGTPPARLCAIAEKLL